VAAYAPMNAPRTGIPLRPDRAALQTTALTSLARACIASAVTRGRNTSASRYVARTWPDDPTSQLILRSPTTPHSTSDAAALTAITTVILQVLSPQSAAADLFGRGIALQFDGAAQITTPRVSLPGGGFVGDGQPIPIRVATTAPGPTLCPHKFASAITLSRELWEHSAAEKVFIAALRESTGPTLDSLAFDADPGQFDLRPPGLLYNIPALVPAAGGGDVAMMADLRALVSAVSPLSGNGGIAFICSEGLNVAIGRLPRFDYPILRSSTLAPDTIIAVAANAVVSSISGAPQIVDVTDNALLHEDDAPSAVRSLWQTDSVAIRLRWPISWGLRSPGGLAWMQNVTW
jgi:hypothetical protein